MLIAAELLPPIEMSASPEAIPVNVTLTVSVPSTSESSATGTVMVADVFPARIVT